MRERSELKSILKRIKFEDKKKVIRYSVVSIVDILGILFLYHSYINSDIIIPSVTLKTIAISVTLIAISLISFGVIIRNKLDDIEKSSNESIELGDITVDELLKNRELIEKLKYLFVASEDIRDRKDV